MLQASLNLSHHSLESFILQQSESERAFQLYYLSQHPKISSISQKINQVWKIFCQQTYLSAKQKKFLSNLNQKQIKSLKMISVLTAFQEKKTVSISALQKELQVDKFTLFKILLEMSAKQIINVTIDELNNTIKIHSARKRYRAQVSKQQLNSQCYARLNRILQENVRLTDIIAKNL